MKKIIFLLFIVFLSLSSINSQNNSNSLENINNSLENRQTLRNQPLPYLDLKSSIQSGELLLDSYSELPSKYSLTFESKSIVDTVLNNIYIENEIELFPIILDEDLLKSNSSEEYQLKRILESDFTDKNWDDAIELLNNFLSVDHYTDIKSKAHFYRAQVLYFQNKYTESFLEFTLVQENLPIAVKPWMDKLLTYLQYD